MLAHAIGSYVDHLWHARTRHAVHSPFVYDLVMQVLRPDDGPPGQAAIERLRDALLKDGSPPFTMVDLGAGSRSSGRQRRIADVARVSLKPAEQARMLHRLVRYQQARHVLELGTSLGITTLYLAAGTTGHVTTIEGCPHTAATAAKHFAALGQDNITQVVGSFQEQLPLVLSHMPRLDLAFIDGHHLQAPTLSYFAMCLEKAHNDTVFVFDDIHWSRDMSAAWQRIKAHPQVTVTIDLYTMGLVFLRREQAKEHFTLRY